MLRIILKVLAVIAIIAILFTALIFILSYFSENAIQILQN